MNRSRADRTVLATLREHSPLHVMDIADRTDEHPVTIDLACARLHDQGKIVCVGLGRYEITDRGMRHREHAIADCSPNKSTS